MMRKIGIALTTAAVALVLVGAGCTSSGSTTGSANVGGGANVNY